MALVDMETDSSSFPSSSSAAARWNYDVFLSFRGEDTRYNFVGHLYKALKRKGIHTFKDDKNLDRGKPISQELLKAIEESRFAIVIISKDYASSAWCLDELAHIIHCKKEMGMTILPVFHYVDPSDIRKQMRTFEQAFIKHEENENKERVEKWRDALREVGNLAGCHLKNSRYETEDIKDIMGWISLHLKYDAFPYITRDLVGLYSPMVELESFLAIGSNDVRFIGVWAMGGMGKTTLARVVYHMVSEEFEAFSFIEDVRENSEKHGLVGLQQKLISNILEETNLKIRDKYDGVLKIRNKLCHRRILLVLDDVNKSDQLQMLAGEHDWFGPGSRIIITTRDVHVLKTHGVDEIYEVKGLNNKDAFQLFCSKAFKKDHVPNEYLVMLKEFLNYAAGLPLALEVLGSFLFGKSTIEWRSALERVKEYPNTEVLNVLQISFDGLHYLEKEIFLHIACFFNHEEKDHIVDVLDSLGLYAIIGLRELINKSLLKIDDNDILWMHDLLEEMGKNIVRQECPNDCGKRSRLWNYEDIENMLKKNKGAEAVQAMHILRNYDDDEEIKETCWSLGAFSQMYNLKFLSIDGIFHDPQHLPNSLRVLCWRYYPSNSLPSTFQLDELVMLRLPKSKIEQLWIGQKNFDKLKFIDLSESGLIISPDFTGVLNLEKLRLSYCKNLRELHPSVGILKKLVLLHLNSCENLMCLPNTICRLKSLECLDLSWCPNIDNLPENLGNLKGLKKLDLTKTAIKELPPSIEGLATLTLLSLRFNKNLVRLPSTICSLNSLEHLDLCGCSNFDNLPENLGNLKGLKKLDLSGTTIKEFPLSIEGLTTLHSLILKDCKNLVCLPSTVCSLSSLQHLNLCECSNFDNLPENLGNLKGLYDLDLRGTAIKEFSSSIEGLTTLNSFILKDCKNLVCLPSTICNLSSLQRLNFCGCLYFENLPENLGNLKGLYDLDLSETAIKEFPSSIEGLTALNSLTLKDCTNLVCLPSTICSLNSLERLNLCGCSNFDNLPENLGNLKGLYHLDLSGTAIKEFSSSIECLMTLTLLTLIECKNLVCLPSTVCSLSSLQRLNLCGCSNFANLPENLGNLKGLCDLDLSGTAIKEFSSSIDGLTTLNSLTLKDCKNLVCLPSSICSLSSLKCLNLCGCSNFDNLPENLGNLKGLYFLDLSGTAVKEFPSSIEGLTALISLTLRDCKNLLCFPSTICSFSSLQRLDLCGCSNFDNLPKNLGSLKGLYYLDLSGTAVKEFPSSIEGLTALISLTLKDCKNLVCLPSTICSLSSLQRLDLCGCSNFDNLPENLGNLKGLNLSGTAVKEFPSSIEGLTALNSLTLRDCKNLVCLPSTICSLSLDLCGCSNFDNLPENLGNLKGLYYLDLSGTAVKEFSSSIEGLTALNSLTLRDCKNLVCLPSTICSLSSLQRLDLCGCSNFDNLPENLGNLKGLYYLDLSGTAVKEFSSSIEGLTTLNSLTLRDCKNLVCLPSTICSLSSLQRLNLCGCSNFDNLPENLGNLKGLYNLNLSGIVVKEFPSSIEGLTALISLTLRDCKNLVCLPSTICSLSSLRCLNLCGCSNFDNLPENLGNLKGLYNFDLSGTAIKEFPSSIEGLTALISLTLRDCKNLVCLPSSICSLSSLHRLDLCGCSNFDNLSENLGNLKGLYYLDLSGTAIKEVSLSIEGLTTLNSLTLKDCKNLVCLPSTICSLSSLHRLDLCGCSNFDNLSKNLGNLKGLYYLDLSGTAIKEVSSSIEGLTTLNSLTLKDCKNLVCLPSTICSLSSLQRLNLCRCSNFDNLPENLGNLKGLYYLDLSGTAVKEVSSSIEGLTTLNSLTLKDCKNLVCLPSTICSLSSLQRLNLCGCSNFDNLPENLGNLKGLYYLDLSGTTVKEVSSSIEGLTTLNSLTLKDCKNLVCLPSTICSLSSLQRLNLCGCSNFDNLPENLGNLKGL
ncbi:disease resistance protein RPV1-like, partial [Quercus suber]|uniref:disease resistance protein RPV1-like n=1 Tax=Quercus suber TaxID=58331 RepID=UPI0032DE7780